MGFSWKCAVGATLGVLLLFSAVVGAGWAIWSYDLGMGIAVALFALLLGWAAVASVVVLWSEIYERCKTAQRFR